MNKKFSFTFPPAIRRNWGYWDGRSAHERGRLPEWYKPGVPMARAHFDRAYGEGFEAGWYNAAPPPNAVPAETPA